MIFADLEYAGRYEEMHDGLCAFLRKRFTNVEAGLQSDSWIWVHIGSDKVAVDTFTSMTHQVKSRRSGKHVDDVIAALQEQYSVVVYKQPEWEAHEDIPPDAESE
jgi:hypothetical protein